MKFIITESKLEKVVFNYLDTIFEIVEYYDNYWVRYKDSGNVVASVVDGKYKVSSHALSEIKQMFTMESIQSDIFFLNWVESKIGFTTTGYSITPYTLYIPSYVK